MKDHKYLERIIKYVQKINRFLMNVQSFESFVLNEEKIDAVILNLEHIGESVKKLSRTYKESHPEVEWKSIAGLRNIISHNHEGIDLRLIYEVATSKINELIIHITVSK